VHIATTHEHTVSKLLETFDEGQRGCQQRPHKITISSCYVMICNMTERIQERPDSKTTQSRPKSHALKDSGLKIVLIRTATCIVRDLNQKGCCEKGNNGLWSLKSEHADRVLPTRFHTAFGTGPLW
jgi:hypothetical protein